ncbi:hypothetical protein SAMN05192588_0526 [Nonlabens sp. Hel1_33_55]|nr:hypothetical protein SAMN05192588_0526 [Nonlabens sp. Hel1_33_55]
MVHDLFDFYLRSSLHVSLCYIAFFAVVALSAGFEPTIWELLAVGTSTLVGYNLAKYVHLLQRSFRFRRWIIALTMVCVVVALVAVVEMGINAIALFLVCGLLTSLYALPEILGRSFRQIPILKLLTIGLCWSLMAVLLPEIIIENSELLENSVFRKENFGMPIVLVLPILKYTLFVIALCIPFEIRDLKYDASELRTLPQLIGIRASEYTGIFLLLIVAGIDIWQFEVTQYDSVIALVIYALTALAIAFSNKFKSDYYASFWVESIPAIWLGLWCAVNY